MKKVEVAVFSFSAGVFTMAGLMTPLILIRKKQIDRAALNMTVMKEMTSTMLETAPPETLAKLRESIEYWEIIFEEL